MNVRSKGGLIYSNKQIFYIFCPIVPQLSPTISIPNTYHILAKNPSFLPSKSPPIPPHSPHITPIPPIYLSFSRFLLLSLYPFSTSYLNAALKLVSQH